jgi:hypothetical protein
MLTPLAKRLIPPFMPSLLVDSPMSLLIHILNGCHYSSQPDRLSAFPLRAALINLLSTAIAMIKFSRDVA